MSSRKLVVFFFIRTVLKIEKLVTGYSYKWKQELEKASCPVSFYCPYLGAQFSAAFHLAVCHIRYIKGNY